MKKLILATVVYTLSMLSYAGEWYTDPDGLKMWIWNADDFKVVNIIGENSKHGRLTGLATITWENKNTGKIFSEENYFKAGLSDYSEPSEYYVNRKPPSDEDLIHSYEGYSSGGNILFSKKDADNNFIITIHGRAEASEKGHAQIAYTTVGFYNYKKDGEENYTPIYTDLIPIILIKLDSDMWIMQYHTKQIIVKKAES